MSYDSGVTIRSLTLEDATAIAVHQRPTGGWATDFPAETDVLVASKARRVATGVPEPWSRPWMIEVDGVVAGLLGFKGDPANDVVEIGYGVVASYQGRGVATSAVSLLIDLLRGRGIAVSAETATWNVASQSVLRHLNFEETGRRHDDDHGELITWRRNAE